MTLKEYFDWKKIKAYKWADEKGYHRSSIYAWMAGKKPLISTIFQIKEDTNGAVGPEDWRNGEK